MKTIKTVNIVPVFVEFIPEVLEQNKIYISEQYKASVHLCLCGCGKQVSLPLSHNFWTLTKNENGSVSFSPSVGNYSYDCKSHYVITKNKANFI